MLLIADSGSTKTSWSLVNKTEKIFFQTEGFNPYYVDAEYICNSLKQNLPEAVIPGEIIEVHFYGAGCSPSKKGIVEDALLRVFPSALVTVDSDMLGATRALLGNNTGFAAILGTGTNTCIYDGNTMVENVDSLGYMLGDEGSGAYLGKKLLRDYIRKRMPADVEEKFNIKYDILPAEIINTVYTKPLPNRFCASFCKFIGENIENAYCRQLVGEAFNDLFENLVMCYPQYARYSFNCCGSVGFYFRDVLEERAEAYGMKIGAIIQSPIEMLTQYHVENSTKIKQNIQPNKVI